MSASILIVYDRPEKERKLREILAQGDDFQVHSAGSGARALDLVEKDPPDIILLATETRDLDGFEVCRRLRTKEATSLTPIILFSHKREASYKMKAFGSGVSDYIVEPLEETEILARVNAQLARVQPSRELEGQIEILTSINITKDRLLRLYSQVNRLLSEVLTRNGHKQMMQLVLERTAQVTSSTQAAVGIFDRENSCMRYDYFLGFASAVPPFLQKMSPAVADDLFRRRVPTTTNTYQESGPIALFRERGVRTSISAPLGSEGELLGMLSLFRTDDRPYGEEEEEHIWVLAPVLAATVFKARYEQKVSNLVTRDPVTNLYNRTFGLEALQQMVARAEARGTPLTIILMEVDNLRGLNAAHGYHVGDAFIKAIGNLIQPLLQKGMHAARFGGEFLIILPGRGANEAEQFASKLLKAVRALENTTPTGTTPATVSLGCAAYFKGEAVHVLYSRVDACLALAKKEGGNRLITGG